MNVQVLDPPHQGAVRSLFVTALHAQNLPTLQERARQDITARLGLLAPRQEWDAVRELARPVARAAIAEPLGVTWMPTTCTGVVVGPGTPRPCPALARA
ncbi:hypothetical protein ACFYW8_42105 [Streptomyces sp. NPDC002742]|uniref:hypothetical protein n=1 Tax=Streptomyces sp. NPDC002742 TaxID=3364663 RepID=UPI0036A7FCEA